MCVECVCVEWYVLHTHIVCLCICLYTFMWRLEIDIRYLPPYFLKQILTELGAHWLTRLAQEPSCLCLTRSGNRRNMLSLPAFFKIFLPSQLFIWGMAFWTQVLVLVWQVLYWLCHLLTLKWILKLILKKRIPISASSFSSVSLLKAIFSTACCHYHSSGPFCFPMDLCSFSLFLLIPQSVSTREPDTLCT